MSWVWEHVNEIPNRVAQAVVTGDPEQVRRVDSEVSAILDSMDVRELLEFADAVRRSYRWYGATRPAWLTMRPSDVKALRRGEAIPTAILGVISFHGNGFIREAALRVLDHVEGGAELRYLLVRLNDWVPEVREAALRAVRRRLTAEYASAFAFHIGLIVRLLAWGRANHFETLGSIVELLRGPAGWPRLPSILDSANAMSRRFLYRLLMDAESEAGRALIRRALRDSEPLTRLEAMRRLQGAKPGNLEVLRAALRDKFSPVRLLAARELANADCGESEDTFIELLMDPAASVRALARQRLGTRIDFARIYQQHLADPMPQRVAAALRGIAEIGDLGSVARVVALVGAADARVAAAALRALAMLDGDNRIADLLDALRSPRLSLVREAARGLSVRIQLVDPKALWEISQDARALVARVRVLKLLFQGPKWSALFYMLACVIDREPEVARRARTALEGWLMRFNSSWAEPSAEQLPRLRNALEAVRGQLPADTARGLEFCLRG